jgi:mono/diheme cytochrome c family protein
MMAFRMTASRATATLLGAALVATVGAGCRGGTFSQPPVHLNPNMDNVTYVEAQEPAGFFADSRGSRGAVANTIAVGELRTDLHLNEGVVLGQWAAELPLSVLEAQNPGDGQTAMAALLERGQSRYGIYCAPCHGDAGLENGGIVPVRGAASGVWSWAVPSLHGARQRGYAVGRLYNVITHGINTMPGYAAQVPVNDRWAIATYVRALQVSYAAPDGMVSAVDPSMLSSQECSE